MGEFLDAFGPSLLTMGVGGSTLLFLLSQNHQNKSDIRHVAFMGLKRTASLVEKQILTKEDLEEEIDGLEKLLNSPHISLLAQMIKGVG